MDAGATERQCQALHGLVSFVPQAWRAGGAGAMGGIVATRLALASLVAACLVAGLTGGLLRLGVILPWATGDWAGHAAAAHGALMIPAFFATVIGIERAVAVKRRWAFAAPVASALAGLCLAAGRPGAGGVLALGASLVFVAVNAQVVRRQAETHTWLLLGGAASLVAGNLVHLAGAGAEAALGSWFAFLVVTIAAERLEMTRMMRRRPGAQGALLGILAMLLAAPVLMLWSPLDGGVVFGAALFLLACWLAAFDIARRTVRAQGLSRYMAACLLAGYAWLGAGGLAWAAASAGWPSRDLALHGLGLGFVFSMVLGHAPVILPAIARVKLAFHPVYYLPLAVLHLSLLWRFGPGGSDLAQRGLAGRWNAVALLLFAAVLALSAWRWRASHRQ